MAKKIQNDRKIEFANFLKSRRAKVKLPAANLSTTTRRRTPGLRREEVAEMAGISLSWYTWLEQARDVNPSAELLIRLGSILKLSESELKHLFALADTPMPTNGDQHHNQIPAALSRLIQTTLKIPACVYNERMEFVLWNEEFTKHFYDIGARPETNRSWLEFLFMEEARHKDNKNWQASVRRSVAEFRMSVSKQLGSAWVKELVNRLTETSELFPQLWKAYDIQERKNMVIDFVRLDGTLTSYERSIYIPQEAEDLRIVLLTPQPG